MSKVELRERFEALEQCFREEKLPLLRYALKTSDGSELFQNISGELSDRHNVFSVSKAFTACAIGYAEAEAKLKLDDKLIDFFPEFKKIASQRHCQITLKNLLQMQSGKKIGLFRHHKSDTKKDYAEIFFSEALQVDPGTEFFYANLNSYILGRVIEKVSGQKLLDYLDERLFTALGFTELHWQDCPNGHNLAYSGLELSIDQMLKFGALLLAGGEWEGQMLLPEGFVERMHTDLVPSLQFPEAETRNGYGYQVWRSSYEDSWRADGLYGQFILIYPSKAAVFACQTETKDDHEAYDIIKLVNRELIPLI
ncbi:MAG: serine hydrolase [Eubacteriales bacterium]|nr:serine hydrolase [Eubacteriales bacterium]